MKKKSYYYLAETSTNGETITILGIKFEMEASKALREEIIKRWGKSFLGINIEVLNSFEISARRYNGITTQINWTI